MSDIVSYNVLENELLLKNILSYLDIHSLRRSQRVSKLWSEVTKQVIKRRQNVVQIFEVCATRRSGKVNGKINNLHSNWDSISEVVEKKTKSDLWYEHKFGLLLHGPCGSRNFKALMPSDKIRKCLPTSSNFVHITSRSGIIGWTGTDSRTAVEVQADVTNGAGISYLLWSDIGINVNVFAGGDSIEHLNPQNNDINLKGIILFTRELYKDEEMIQFPEVEKLYEAYNHKLAVGGLVVQHINYLKGHSQVSQESLSWIGLAISGPHVKMASCVLESENTDDLRAELEKFKSSLDFEVTQNVNSKTVGILLACNGRGKYMFSDANVEVEVFASVFSGVRLTGCYGDGEFGLDYWPRGGNPVRREEDFVEGNKWWHFYSSVLILINVPLKSV